MFKLFLDDNRLPKHVWSNTIDPDYEDDNTWIIVRTYEAFVKCILEKGLPDLISFDHDLVYDHYLVENQRNIDYSAMQDKTGYHAAEWLIEYCKENKLVLPKTKVHSMNPAGKLNIELLLEHASKDLKK